MLRHCLLALGSCCLLGACGSQFSASDGAGGVSSMQGGASAQGGSDASGARAGADQDEDAGTDAGGGVSAAGSAMDGAGTGGVAVSGRGGASGAGGVSGQSPIPELGLALWLRADLGVQQTDGLVETWLDQSGNQLNAVQAGLNVRPKYLAKGLNGLPALKFDGEAQFMVLPEGFAQFSRGLAAFMVLRPSNADCSSVVEFSNGTEIDDVSFGMWLDKWSYEVDVPYIQNGNVDLLAPSVYAVNHRPATTTVKAAADLRINGALMQTLQMPVPKVIARQDNFIGHTLYTSCNYFAGTISEIILYQRAVTANEVKAIESYLEQHWGLGPIVAP